MTAEGKGILAADESHGTLNKKFTKINLESTEENRMKYRKLLFTTPDLEKYISGVILFSETIEQKDENGKPLRDYLKEKDIVIGIKLDLGSEDLVEGSEERFTKGLDDLRERAKHYFDLGARFAKWRCILQLKKDKKGKEIIMPTDLQIESVGHTLARYAKICQEAGLVPIVEPELIPDGNYTIEDCAKVSKKIFKEVFSTCESYRVGFDGCLFKPHMIKEGAESKVKSTPEQVAE